MFMFQNHFVCLELFFSTSKSNTCIKLLERNQSSIQYVFSQWRSEPIMSVLTYMFSPTYYVCAHILCLSPPIMSVSTYYVCPHPERSEYFFGDRIRIRIYSESNSGPNTNTNIFVIIKRTEYEYSNILGSNIRILFDEYSNIP